MPFGLTNAPSTFQSLMNHIFKPFLRKFVLVFFDDILVFSHTFDAHVSHLRTVLLENKLFPKQSKCVFRCQEVKYLGVLIFGHGVRTDPKKAKAMQQWPIPTSIKALRGFLELTGYYRNFIKDFGLIAALLTAFLKKDSFHWSHRAEKAFDALKQAISSPPVLALPNFSKPFVVKCDASRFGLGAILMQENKPLAFHNEALNGMCLHLSTYEKEPVKTWRSYLVGRPFLIRTDQYSLEFLPEQRMGTPAQ